MYGEVSEWEATFDSSAYSNILERMVNNLTKSKRKKQLLTKEG